MEAAVTVVAEEQLVIIFGSATDSATLALDALPTIAFADCDDIFIKR